MRQHIIGPFQISLPDGSLLLAHATTYHWSISTVRCLPRQQVTHQLATHLANSSCHIIICTINVAFSGATT